MRHHLLTRHNVDFPYVIFKPIVFQKLCDFFSNLDSGVLFSHNLLTRHTVDVPFCHLYNKYFFQKLTEQISDSVDALWGTLCHNL